MAYDRIKKKFQFTTTQFTVLVTIITLVISLVFVSSEWGKRQQEEQIKTYEEYLTFQSQVELFVNGSLNFIRGYSAFLNTLELVDNSSTTAYLDELLLDDEYPITNIAVIEDTTIVSVYPIEGNETAIGVDLAYVAGQKDQVLKVKKELKPLFAGPVDLVEGGKGFISRIPLIKGDEYYGQIGIVLEANQVIDRIESIASDLNIAVNVFSDENTVLKMIEDDTYTLSTVMELIGVNWNLEVKRMDKNEDSLLLFYYVIISLMVSLFIGSVAGIIYHQRSDLKKLAFTDYLTGVYNRNFIEHYIPMVFQRAIRENHSVGVYHIDINDFKGVNDTYGHHIGDLVLQDISKRTQELIRNYETVFRLGGDEFMVVATGLNNEEEFLAIRERLSEGLSYTFERNSVTLKISASVGGAMYPRDGRSFDEVLQRSDKMMYKMKDKMKSNMENKDEEI